MADKRCVRKIKYTGEMRQLRSKIHLIMEDMYGKGMHLS